MSLESISNIKQLPYAGFWEWDISKKTETISHGLASTFGLEYPVGSDEGEFWKTILAPDHFSDFLRWRKDILARPGGHSYVISQNGLTKDGQLISFTNRMEVTAWSAGGKAVRMTGCITEDNSNAGSLLLDISESDLLAKLADQIPGAIFQYQYLSNGLSRYPYASKGIWDVYELTPQEVKNDAARVFDRIHPDDLDRVIESIHQSYVSLAGWEEDYRVVLPSRGLRWLRGSAKPERLDDGSVLWNGYLTDITSRKKTEEALVKVNTDLQAILNSGSQVSIISTGLDGIIAHFSKGSENLLGYKASEVVGKESPVIFHIEEEIILRQKQLTARFGREISGFDVFVEMARRGKHDTREWTYRRKDGSTFPVQLVVTAIFDDQKNVCGFLGIASDISQIKKTEKALIESEERWQFALEGAGEGVWDWDLSAQNFFTSIKSKKMLGYREQELPNAEGVWMSLIHPDDTETYRKALDRHLNGDTQVYTCEYRVRCRSGEYKWILDRGKVLHRSPSGKPLRIIGTHADISGIKQKEDDLRRTIDIIGEQNRRLLNFAHIVSHNLRSHSGNFEMMFKLLDDADTPAEKDEMLGHIRTISEKLGETITHLNEVVMVQTSLDLQKRKINLHDYINKTIKILTANISAKGARVTNLVPADMEVTSNPAYMESILLNLLSNAVKYSHPDRRPEVTFSASIENAFTKLEVRDNGLGIDLALHHDKLFGMYKTFHPNKDAKGIGLFITKNQVEAMGGKIEAESKVNNGSVFKVYLK